MFWLVWCFWLVGLDGRLVWVLNCVCGFGCGLWVLFVLLFGELRWFLVDVIWLQVVAGACVGRLLVV